MWDESTEVCIIMASDYGIRHLIANFEELITILKDETGLACRSQVGTISKFYLWDLQLVKWLCTASGIP